MDGGDPLDVLLRHSWHAVAVAADIGENPVSVTLLDVRLVLARLEGDVHAFDDQCPHRGAALSVGWVADDQIVCPYHGWVYDSEGTCVRVPSLGDSTHIPSRARLRRRHAAVHLGLVWVALEDPVFALPDFPEYANGDVRIVACPPYDWECHATRRIENFLDFAHFPWIHPGILGDPAQPLVPAHTVWREGSVLHVHQTRVEPANDEVKTAGLDVGDDVTSEMRYLIHLPLTAQLHQELPGDRHYVVWLTATPVSQRCTRTFWFVGRNYALDEDDEKYIRFQQDVVAQDRPVIESQRPSRIPYELGTELHVKDDKVCLEFRRGLIEYADRLRAGELSEAPACS